MPRPRADPGRSQAMYELSASRPVPDHPSNSRKSIQFERSAPCCRRAFGQPEPVLATQQGQHALGQLIGLRHHGRTGLLQDLGTRQVGGFDREVGILNPAARRGEVCLLYTSPSPRD